MNIEEEMHETSRALLSEYRGYNIVGARQDLEDRIISAEASEVAYPHPSAEQLTLVAAPQTSQQLDDWRGRGACRTLDPDRLFVRGAAQHDAKIVCLPCPVRARCLAEALDHRIEFGVWGGMTERERRALLRRRPDVRSWSELLEKAAGARNDNSNTTPDLRDDIIAS